MKSTKQMIVKMVIARMINTGCTVYQAAQIVAAAEEVTPKEVMLVCRTTPRQEGERLDIWMARETC
jgi:hypothetical protein